MYRLMHSVFSPMTHALYPYMAKERKLGVLARIAVLCVALAAVGSVAGHFLLPV